MQSVYFTLMLYLAFFLFAYNDFKYSQSGISKRNIGSYLVLGGLLMLRLLISVLVEGHTTDINCFKIWAQRLAQVGTKKFYAPDYFADYPPGYMLVLYVLGHIERYLGLTEGQFTMLIKLPAMASDVLIAYIILRQAQKEETPLLPWFLMLVFGLNPAVVLNSAMWGQMDSFFTLFMVLSLICVYKNKLYLGAFLYAVCILIKPQGLIIAPLYLGAYLYKTDLKVTAKSIGIGLAALFLCALPFTEGFNFLWLFEKYFATLTSYPYATVNAYNIYALFGMNWAGLDYKFLLLPIGLWSYAVIVGITLFSVWLYVKSQNRVKIFYIPYLIITVMFTFGAKMHERYLYPALVLLVFAYIFSKDRRLIWLFAVQTISHYLNVADVLAADLGGREITNVLVGAVAVLNIAVAVYSFYLAFDVLLGCKKTRAFEVYDENITLGKMAKKDYVIMLSITAVYSIVAFTNLGDFTAPQTFNSTDRQMIIDFGEEKSISSVMLYLGIGSGEYTIKTSVDGGRWDLYKKQKHNSVFIWRRVAKQAQARYIMIEPDRTGLMLGEVGAFDVRGNLILPVGATSHEIIDEQNCVPPRPSYMNGTYFDEVYHPRTAYEIIHKIAPYEITHPPLGKLILSLGILMFGMTPFGWRFMGTLTGVLMVPLFYAFAKKLFKSTHLALVGTILFTFDFMHFAQTRLATIDSYAVLFIILMYYYMLDYFVLDFNSEPLSKGFLALAKSGVFFAIGVATKWICIYAGAGLAAMVFYNWIKSYFHRNSTKDYISRLYKSILWCLVFFIILPACVYFVSYLPQIRYDLHGRTPMQYVLENQTYMFSYHKGVTEDHPYGSLWYEWLVNKRPLWAYINGELKEQGIISSISSFGNPLVWWSGLFAMGYCIYLAIFRKNKIGMFLCIAYFSQLVPWMFISRVVFIYHYFACVAFIVLAIVETARRLLNSGKVKMGEIYGFAALAIVLFIMFYPVISGVGVSPGYVKNVLRWFDSWVFMN